MNILPEVISSGFFMLFKKRIPIFEKNKINVQFHRLWISQKII